LYYDGWSLIQEGPNSASISQVYLLGNRVDEIVADYAVANGQWMFHHSEGRGHCMMLTDWNGNLAEQYEYDAFGKPYVYDAAGNWIGHWDSGGWHSYSARSNRFLFTGREYLADLKLYDYRNRLYQPELGRFMEPDPKHFAAGDYNLYRYCHNDPVNRSDPFGLAPVIIDADTDALTQQADARNLAAFQNDRVLFGLLNIPWFEHATTVYSNNAGQRSLSETRTDRDSTRVIPPEDARLNSLVETHNHTTNKNDFYTHTRVSRGDVNRGDITGRPQEVISPDGSRQRYRPSDASTLEGRRQEGGALERLNNGKWERIEGGNTNMKDWRDHRHGH
jgi:RHS repeat-associated protein